MWWLQNKLNLMHAQKWHSFNHIRSVPVTLVVLITVMSVLFASAQIQYPKERVSLVAKDNNTLLDPGFLPFLTECSKSNVGASKELCTMYYDMVYNTYELGAKGLDTKIAIQKADKELDNQQLVKEFCEIFRNETTNTLDKQPFSQTNGYNITEWIKTSLICEVNCLQKGKQPNLVEIKQVCKFISGGCRWIGEQKKKLYFASLVPPNANQNLGEAVNDNAGGKGDANAAVNNENKARPIAIINANANGNSSPAQNTLQDPAPNNDAITNAKSSSNPEPKKPNSKAPEETQISKQVEISVPAGQQPQRQLPAKVTPSLNRTSPSNLTTNNNKSSNINIVETKIVQPPPLPPAVTPKQARPLSPDNESEDDLEVNDKKPDIDDENPEIEDETEEDNHNEEEVPLEMNNSNNNINVNNMHNTQSRLLANQGEFRADKESSFFPYFMFLMFVVVTFYVAYHNKSKILALLIEGRRSRSYSSRSGSGRRKQHSAEYRKLDSNLEEAIQSDGGHVLSTQIIY
ncbi:trans-Golgi network integral membrane protein 1-like [Sitodiplosis mosellana]|uniref:trans-Golgi network integral membrane protein 1-like n=1 Tax=Sitodiplosis mosellana TaxID=263140 RepID=UPI00244397D5|nr:trans-Golgi network integral membrane protein 1-like [Sitodiplosis mosellana]